MAHDATAGAEVTTSDEVFDHRDKLEKFRVDFVQTLDVERQFIFSYLRSKSVLDEEDCERIVHSGAGRKQKVSKFLDVLACKGEEAYMHFVDSLEFEQPTLYEKVTGKRASANRNSPMLIAGCGGRAASNSLFGKELIDYDRQYLATQLAKTAGDLQMLTYVHSKMVKEKNNLESRLLEAMGDLESQQKQIDDLQEELKTITAFAVESQQNSVQDLEPINHFMQNLVQENRDKSNTIITLQHRMLVSNDELDQTKRIMEELREKNEALMQQFRDLTINYDWERRQSKRLNERVQRQTDEIRKSEDVRREIYELKFKLTAVRDERDELNEQLQELRKVTEALNMKFDLMVQEKELHMEIHEEVSDTIFHFQQQVHALEMKLKESNLELREAQRKNGRMTEEIKTYKEQRTTLLQEREVNISQRNTALKERDESLRMNQELQCSRDEGVTKYININRTLETKYKTMSIELDETKQELGKMESKLKNMELIMQHKPVGYSSPYFSDSEIKERRLKKTKTDKIAADIEKEPDDDTDNAYNRMRDLKKRVSEPHLFHLRRNNAELMDMYSLTALRKVRAETVPYIPPKPKTMLGLQPPRIISDENSPSIEIPPESSCAVKCVEETHVSVERTKINTEIQSKGAEGIGKIRQNSLPASDECPSPTIKQNTTVTGVRRSKSSCSSKGAYGGILSSLIHATSDLTLAIPFNMDISTDSKSSPDTSPCGSPHSKHKLGILQTFCRNRKGSSSPTSPLVASTEPSKIINTDVATTESNNMNGNSISSPTSPFQSFKPFASPETSSTETVSHQSPETKSNSQPNSDLSIEFKTQTTV